MVKDSVEKPEAFNLFLKSLLIKTTFRFAAYIGSALAFTWLILEFVFGYIFKTEPLAGTGTLGILIVIAFCFALSFIISFRYFYSQLKVYENVTTVDRIEAQSDEKQLEKTLIDELESAYNDEEWEEVIKIGSVLSRPLWTTGKYKLRVKLGKLIESAAAFSNHYTEQASALIDDLGWTNFILGNNKEAEKNINHGITIAEKNGDAYLVYKGFRHLSGIAMESGDLNQAIANHNKSKLFAEKISDIQQKQEILAGIYVNVALLKIKQCNWEKAYNDLDKAQNMFREMGDKDREAKLYHFKGDTLFGLGRFKDAKDVYRKGLAISKRESRKDAILWNTIGLGNIAIEEGDNEDAKEAYLEASLLAHKLGLDKLAEELKIKAS